MVGVLGLLMVHRCWERLGGVKGNGNRGWEGGRIQGGSSTWVFVQKCASHSGEYLGPCLRPNLFILERSLPPSSLPLPPLSLSFEQQ